MSSSQERATEYRRTAARLRGLSQRAQYPQVSAELAWLAHSYERLADESTEGRILDDRALDNVDPLDRSN